MQFTVPVDAGKPVKPDKLPDTLNYIPALKEDSPKRIVTLNDITGPSGNSYHDASQRTGMERYGD